MNTWAGGCRRPLPVGIEHVILPLTISPWCDVNEVIALRAPGDWFCLIPTGRN
jgi:hypothetical protein